MIDESAMREPEALPVSASVPASDYVIIGGTGDLSTRKIFPALFLRFLAGQITNEFRFFKSNGVALAKCRFLSDRGDYPLIGK